MMWRHPCHWQTAIYMAVLTSNLHTLPGRWQGSTLLGSKNQAKMLDIGRGMRPVSGTWTRGKSLGKEQLDGRWDQ